MVICSLDALKESSKKKKTKIKVLQQASYRKENTKLKAWNDEFFTLTLYLLARITLTLISSAAFIGYFEKVNFEKGIGLVV